MWRTIELWSKELAMTALAWLIILSCAYAFADDEEDPVYLCAITVGEELMRPAMFSGEAGMCTFLDHMKKVDAKIKMVCFDIHDPDASEIKSTATGMRAVMRCDNRKGVKGL